MAGRYVTSNNTTIAMAIAAPTNDSPSPTGVRGGVNPSVSSDEPLTSRAKPSGPSPEAQNNKAKPTYSPVSQISGSDSSASGA